VTSRFGANYTVQLKNNGNSTSSGEPAGHRVGVRRLSGNPRPRAHRYCRKGRLADYQKHKLRIYGTYTQKMGRFGFDRRLAAVARGLRPRVQLLGASGH